MSISNFTRLVAYTIAACQLVLFASGMRTPGTLVNARNRPRIVINADIRAQFNLKPFELTNVCFDCDRQINGTNFDCHMSLTWYDPNSAAENNVTTATCSYHTVWTGATAKTPGTNVLAATTTPYQTCYVALPTFFELSIEAFDGFGNFTISLGHQYHDSADFTAPWDWPTMFAEPQINVPLLYNHTDTLTWFTPGPIYANVTQISD